MFIDKYNTPAAVQEQASFLGFVAEPRDVDVCPHYVLWRDGEVRAKGSAETIKLALRTDVNYLPSSQPRDWEPPGYEHI